MLIQILLIQKEISYVMIFKFFKILIHIIGKFSLVSSEPPTRLSNSPSILMLKLYVTTF